MLCMKNAMKENREHQRHLLRVFWIDQQLRSNRFPNTHTIATHF